MQLKGLTKYNTEIKRLAKKTGLSKTYLLIDGLWSRFRYGCALNHYTVGNFYKRTSFERKTIYTYRYWCKVVSSVNDNNAIHYLKNKVDFNTYFSDYIKRDWLYSISMTYEEYYNFCKNHNDAIIKPINGLEGNGIEIKLLPKDETNIKKSFDEYKKTDVLIEQKIIQHPSMVFGNKSVNTIRIYTTLNANSKDITIIKAVVRAGIGSSIVDNSHSGGCAYEIDIKTGHIISPYYAANGLSSYIHPNTGICMLGKLIPYWEDVKNLCIQSAKKLPTCRYIGWDVAITSEGPLLIEGNHLPDLDMIEFVGSFGYKEKIIKGLGL